MPQRTNYFQRLVYLIQEQLKDRPGTVVTESKMLVDRISGEKTEVDIAVESIVHGIPFVLAIECRESNRRPTRPWVQLQVKRHETLSDKLVLIANRPFSKTALGAARRDGAETVVFGEATKTNWPALIDQYTNLIFSTFGFKVKSFTAEYEIPLDAPRFSNELMISLSDVFGKSSPLAEAIQALVRNHELFGKRVLELWQKKTPEQRKPEHTVTIEYVPPLDQPMTLSQGVLAYSLKKLIITVAAKIGEARLAMGQAGYLDMRVTHGSNTLSDGELAGQTVTFVMTEKQGQPPSGIVMLSGKNGSDKTLVRKAEILIPKPKSS